MVRSKQGYYFCLVIDPHSGRLHIEQIKGPKYELVNISCISVVSRSLDIVKNRAIEILNHRLRTSKSNIRSIQEWD